MQRSLQERVHNWTVGWIRNVLVLGVVGIFAFLGTVPVLASSVFNDEIANRALQYVGQWGGQCKAFVQRVVNEVAGYYLLGTGYRAAYLRIGLEISPQGATRGDIIQIYNPQNPESYRWGYHTAIILRNLGGGRFQVVDSNFRLDERVTVHEWNPFVQARRYGLRVAIYRLREARPQDRTLIRAEGSPDVFWYQNGKRYHVVSPAVLNAMVGLPGWGWNQVHVLPASLVDRIPRGPEFVLPGSASDGLLLRQQGTTPVYLVQGGRLRWIPNPTVFERFGFAWEDVIEVTPQILGLLPQGPTLSSLPEGAERFRASAGGPTFALRIQPGSTLQHVRLFDLQGHTVGQLRGPLSERDLERTIRRLPVGVYLARLFWKDELGRLNVTVKKIVILR